MQKMGGFRRRRKLAILSVVLAVMLSLPAAMYYAANAGSRLWLSILGVVMSASMVLAAWIG